MERTKADLIKELMSKAQDAIWTNELVIANAEAGNIDKKEAEKAKVIIGKDKEYMQFLQSQLPPNNVTGT